LQQIADWLESLGLRDYAERFEANAIDLGVLRDLTDQDLKELGVLLGHRRKLLRAIAEMDGAAPKEPLPPPAAERAPQGSAERRQLTVMFCDLVGSTAISARLDPEDMREVILAYQSAGAGVMRAYDGFVAKFMGDGILGYFGYPRAHEDDAERAVRAGLDIVAAVTGLKTRAPAPLKVRIGIATGLVVVGDLIGDGASQEQAVVGDTPNLAARLQYLAEPGTVVVAASTRRLLGDLFDLRDLGRKEVRGIPEPVAAWAVDGISSSESRFESVRSNRMTGFVGREEEIGLLLGLQKRAWRGEGQIVLLSGEAGIGKSRIAAALGERIVAEPHTRVRYQCSPYHTNSALYPFIAQLEWAARFKPDDTPEQRLDKLEAALVPGSEVATVAPLLAALLSIPSEGRYPPLTLSPTEQRRETFTALLDQLESLAGQSPLLWLFEDAHWADATSRELIDLAVDRMRRLPVLAIITFRPEFEPPWIGQPNVSTLALGRLDRSDVQSMVARVTGGRAMPAEVMEQIVVKTDGNPLFVEELTKTVMEAGILVEHADGYRLDGPLRSLAIPATLHDSLMARLDYLAPIKEIAQVGAAIGREFSFALLGAVVARDETALKSALAQLEHAELVFRRGEPPEAVYTFKHALVQDAAYESLLRSRRQVLHLRIAEALRDRFGGVAAVQPEVVAHHFTQAGADEAAADWWGKAGELALRRSAHEEALAHLEKALGLAIGLAEGSAQRRLQLRLELTRGNALIAARGHHAEETTAAFARALEIAHGIEEAPDRFSAYYGLCVGSFSRGELAAARLAAEAFLRGIEQWPRSPEAGVAHRVYGMTCWIQGDFAEARTHLEQAIAIYDPRRDRELAFRFGYDTGTIAKASLAVALLPLGEVDRARVCIEEAIVMGGQSGHVPTICYTFFISAAFEAMRHDASRVAAHTGALMTLSREHGLPSWTLAGTVLHRWGRWRSGDGEITAADINESLAFIRKNVGYHFLQPLGAALAAEAEVHEGRLDAALSALDEQLLETERTGQRWYDAELYRLRGDLLLARDPADAKAAETAFMGAIETAHSQQARTFELRAALALARLYDTTGRNGAARELLTPALAGFVEDPDLPEIEQASRLLASLRGPGAAGENLGPAATAAAASAGATAYRME